MRSRSRCWPLWIIQGGVCKINRRETSDPTRMATFMTRPIGTCRPPYTGAVDCYRFALRAVDDAVITARLSLRTARTLGMHLRRCIGRWTLTRTTLWPQSQPQSCAQYVSAMMGRFEASHTCFSTFCVNFSVSLIIMHVRTYVHCGFIY